MVAGGPSTQTTGIPSHTRSQVCPETEIDADRPCLTLEVDVEGVRHPTGQAWRHWLQMAERAQPRFPDGTWGSFACRGVPGRYAQRTQTGCSFVCGDTTSEVAKLAGLHGEVHGLPEEKGERARYHAWAASVP
jgi:hypothetical protein